MYVKAKMRFLLFVVFTLLIFFNISQSQTEQDKETLYPEKRLMVGNPVPELSFKDIDGHMWTNMEYRDWVIVYSFADRKSNKSLQEVIPKAGRKVGEAYPELKTVYVSIADATIVPPLLHDFVRSLITPYLQRINNKYSKDLHDFYEREGISLEVDKPQFIMAMDWDGHLMKTFGLSDTKNYHSFVVFAGRIISVLDSKTPDFIKTFHQAFDKINATRVSREKNEELPEPAVGSEPE
ncbi:MAG: hypothetical protein JSU92_11030 [Deltaproteobacteria bacterium]|nr:MAG: hypothetical protein JSU92_11030 [Deltaproteobacteria bacterium]